LNWSTKISFLFRRSAFFFKKIWQGVLVGLCVSYFF
jgi:hypothetical protein